MISWAKTSKSAERIGVQRTANKTPDTAIDSAIQSPIDSANTTELSSALKLYCARLMTYKKNRSAKKDTLLNSINIKVKDSPISAEEVLKN